MLKRWLAAIFRYSGAPAYVLGMMAVIFVPWWLAPYNGPPPDWFAKPKPVRAEPAAKASLLSEPLKPNKVTPIIYARLDPHVQRAAATATPEHSLPWSCEAIRSAVAKLSKDQRDRLARIYRLTDKQKAAAERCLKERT